MDEYSATWVSHSSISDFLKCPRSYYLRNVYKNPKTGHKMTIVTPPMALGAAVHEVIESLAGLPAEERLKVSLVKKLDPVWQKVSGEKGGFKNFQEESEFKNRARQMLINLQENPGPLVKKAIRIKSDMNLPHFWLNKEDGIILAGKIDWLSYSEETDSVEIIDFKTGRNEEKEDSLQLPIYLLVATNTQSKKVTGVYYWYLDKDEGMVEKNLPDEDTSYKKVYAVAKRIRLARKINHFKCPTDGCWACRPYERILKGEGKLVGVSDTRQDIYTMANMEL